MDHTHQNQTNQSLTESTDTNCATDIWAVPNKNPFRKILLSPDFAKELTQRMEKRSPVRYLTNFWKDYKKIIRYSPPIDVNEPLRVCTEYGQYIAVEHLCGRVSFYSPSDTPRRYQH